MYLGSGANKLWVCRGLDLIFISTSRLDLNEFWGLGVSREEDNKDKLPNNSP